MRLPVPPQPGFRQEGGTRTLTPPKGRQIYNVVLEAFTTVVPPTGVEPARPLRGIATSRLRVCQIHHGGSNLVPLVLFPQVQSHRVPHNLQRNQVSTTIPHYNKEQVYFIFGVPNTPSLTCRTSGSGSRIVPSPVDTGHPRTRSVFRSAGFHLNSLESPIRFHYQVIPSWLKRHTRDIPSLQEPTDGLPNSRRSYIHRARGPPEGYGDLSHAMKQAISLIPTTNYPHASKPFVGCYWVLP